MSRFPQIMRKGEMVAIRQPITDNKPPTCEGCPVRGDHSACSATYNFTCIGGPTHCVLVELKLKGE